MAEDQDDSQKTEDPTPKRLADARRKGNLPVSREVATGMAMVVMALLTGFFGGPFASGTLSALLPLATTLHDIRIEDVPRDVMAPVWSMLFLLAPLLAVILAGFAAGGIFSAMVQGGIVVAFDRIKPKTERIDPIKGVGRLFSWSSLMEFGKGIVKIILVGSILTTMVIAQLSELESSMSQAVVTLPEIMRDMTLQLLIAALMAMLVVTAADVLWRRFDWHKKLRMTRQQVKDELKNAEGDPHVKARVREIRRERARRRMMAAVPSATVVITNPTHYAIALKYDRGGMPAPCCVAKGTDKLALKIREVAKAHNVPVIENPPLARALHATIEVDQMIPQEHFQAVAEIITYVYRTDARAARA